MARTFIKSRLRSNKQKLKINPKLSVTKSKLPLRLQSFQTKTIVKVRFF